MLDIITKNSTIHYVHGILVTCFMILSTLSFSNISERIKIFPCSLEDDVHLNC